MKVSLTSFWISEDFSVLFVDSDQPDGVDERQEDGGEADRTLEQIQWKVLILLFSVYKLNLVL